MADGGYDVARHVSRLARDQHDVAGTDLDDIVGRPADLALGLRRARAAALLMLALPGSVYLYQGEELGLHEVEDLPDEPLRRPDLAAVRTDRARPGRLPGALPWSGDAPPFGCGPDDGAAPWLPQPDVWSDRTAAALDDDPDSILQLYRTALRLRRRLDGLGDGGLQWIETGPEVLLFSRKTRVRVRRQPPTGSGRAPAQRHRRTGQRATDHRRSRAAGLCRVAGAPSRWRRQLAPGRCDHR